MKYKRLTKKCEVGVGLTKTSGNIVYDYEIVVNRLAELEDKIENKTLIELPCKINDIVYDVCKKPSGNPFVNFKIEYFIVEHKIGDIKMSMIGTKPIFRILTLNNELGVMAWSGEHIGTRLFLTKAEAEQKLKELKGE